MLVLVQFMHIFYAFVILECMFETLKCMCRGLGMRVKAKRVSDQVPRAQSHAFARDHVLGV